jgi:hypothetical protein
MYLELVLIGHIEKLYICAYVGRLFEKLVASAGLWSFSIIAMDLHMS